MQTSTSLWRRCDDRIGKQPHALRVQRLCDNAAKHAQPVAAVHSGRGYFDRKSNLKRCATAYAERLKDGGATNVVDQADRFGHHIDNIGARRARYDPSGIPDACNSGLPDVDACTIDFKMVRLLVLHCSWTGKCASVSALEHGSALKLEWLRS
jgi:hypothetical protein